MYSSQLLCAECNTPCQWDLAIDKAKPPTSAAKWQGNDHRSAMSSHKTLSSPGPVSYLCGLALRIWTSFWRREGSTGMDMWNTPMVQSKPLTYRLMESVGLGGLRWHGSSWQRGIAESRSSRLSTLVIDIPGDLVWDLSYVQQASYLEGAHWCGCCPCTCMLIKNLMMMKTSESDDQDQPTHLLCLIRVFPAHLQYHWSINPCHAEWIKMPHPLLNFNQWDYWIQVVDTNSHNAKQCRSRSVGFWRSQLIWIYTVYKSRAYPGSAGQGLKCTKEPVRTQLMRRLILVCTVHTCPENTFSYGELR